MIDYKDIAMDIVKLAHDEPANLAIVRPSANFRVISKDNPAMQQTLSQQALYVEAHLAAKNYKKKEERQQAISALKDKFQRHISYQAFKEQLGLIKALQEQGIYISIVLDNEEDSIRFSDKVFFTDTGHYFIQDNQLHFIAAYFKNPQRQGEEQCAIVKAQKLGASVHNLMKNNVNPIFFEGGDLRQAPDKDLWFFAYGIRSEQAALPLLKNITRAPIVPIQLCQAQFYHLDCCFLPLPHNAAVIYEGEYEYQNDHTYKPDKHGWPRIIPGTETMTVESRANIRQWYKPEQLILLTRLEAEALATNAVILKSHKDNRLKLFVNGQNNRTFVYDHITEKEAIRTHLISYTHEHLQRMRLLTNNQLDIIEIPYSTMHLSGGSVRCSIQEAYYTSPYTRL